MAELGRTDIEARWLAHSLRFWNSLRPAARQSPLRATDGRPERGAAGRH